MKHLRPQGGNDKWTYVTDPFPAFVCELYFGDKKGKRDQAVVTVAQGLTPELPHITTCHDDVLYIGNNREAAYAAKRRYDAEPFHNSQPATVTPQACILPTHAFLVVKDKVSGQIFFAPGADITERCLLFLALSGQGEDEREEVFAEQTTGTILVTCSAAARDRSTTCLIALLEPQTGIVAKTYGKLGPQVVTYGWNGKDLNSATHPLVTWQASLEGPDEARLVHENKTVAVL